MENWIKEQDGNVIMVHHSTSSVVELIVLDEDNKAKSLYMDYYDFESLVKVIQKINLVDN